MIVKIFKVAEANTENELVSTLPIGKHVVGRDTLQCSGDKTISRKHLLFDVTQDCAKVTCTHVNPCYVTSLENTICLIKGEVTQLNDNDKFSLSNGTVWYKVNFCADKNSDLRKRCCETDTNISPKKLKTEEIEIKCEPTIDEVNLNGNVVQSEDRKHELKTLNDIFGSKSEGDSSTEMKTCNSGPPSTVYMIPSETTATTVKPETIISISSETDTSNSVIVKETASAETGDVSKQESSSSMLTCKTGTDEPPSIQSIDVDTEQKNSSTNSRQATGNTLRDRCWYGPTCFRRNPEHMQQFSHPGDADYLSYPNDPRPGCSYGAACYRKSSKHRIQYKHEKPPAKRPSSDRQRRDYSSSYGSYATYDEDDDDDVADPSYTSESEGDESEESDYTSNTGDDNKNGK
ncbi:aprataxin and PNK-like factor [Aethina tumida]|uniref:aprataxin and PNK-like factor n=1 Tax=Aethina tumida TaxID=116153 RepID=UPI00096AFA57|nr:aprataxin and PNK-like factor [Aethina tumida]